MTGKKLTEQDVSQLLNDPSSTTRADTAAKIASEFGSGRLSPSERKLAEEIFRIMVRDAEVRVREALSQNLKENPAVPRDIAVTLARDVDTVALPVLQFSEVLTDDDLVEIVRSQDTAKQVAVAGRPRVSETVSAALVDTKKEEVVGTLVSNVGAEIPEASLQKVVDDFGQVEHIQDAMVHRARLPVTVCERLVTMVSERLKEELAKHHELPSAMTTMLILQSRERAIIGLSTESEEEDVEKLVHQLNANKRLTPSIVLRSVCMGDLRFFEASMAELSGIPLINARQLIHDAGGLGLERIYDKTGLPRAHITAVKAAIDVARETDYDGGENDRARYSRRMIERILTQYGDLGVDFEADDLEYLLTKMAELPGDVQYPS